MTEPHPPPANGPDDATEARPADGDASGPPMPAAAPAGATDNATAPKAGVGRQVAQLVVIPALIVIAGIVAALLFVWMASTEQSLEDQLARLHGCGGTGRGPLGLQDPRYKDCWHAAFGITSRIDTIRDESRRAKVSDELVQILNQQVSDKEGLLPRWLLEAIGRLGQADAMPVLIKWLDAPSPGPRHGAIKGLLAWPDQDMPRSDRAVRLALPKLLVLLDDSDADVAMVAAAAVGELAASQDDAAVPALAAAMDSGDLARRYVRWTAAVALARLGDTRGDQLVAGLLLDRAELARHADSVKGEQAPPTMTGQTQDQIILSTLAAARDMTSQTVWDKIKHLADNDSNAQVQAAARQLLLARQKQEN